MSPQGRKVSFVEPPPSSTPRIFVVVHLCSSPLCVFRGLLRSSLARLLPLRASASAYGGSLRCSYTPLFSRSFQGPDPDLLTLFPAQSTHDTPHTRPSTISVFS